MKPTPFGLLELIPVPDWDVERLYLMNQRVGSILLPDDESGTTF
jgi:hypothetical protein